ncbi:hypothetical protein F5Y10DRAFT_287656 [Nemania abortiva]|nr:hypothetical protein F5Y10DRAFT_287656 [Nemania abortiva]
MADQRRYKPLTEEEWHAMFCGSWGTSPSMTLKNINDRRAKTNVSGSTFQFAEFLCLRAFFPATARYDVFSALTNTDLLDKECWDHVQDTVFSRDIRGTSEPLDKEVQYPLNTSRLGTAQSLSADPSTTNILEATNTSKGSHYSPELPMGTFYNFQQVLRAKSYGYSPPYARRKLEYYIGTFRTVLSHVSDVAWRQPRIEQPRDTEEPIRLNEDYSPVHFQNGRVGTENSPSAQRIASEEEQEDGEEDESLRSLDETINTIFFGLVVNTIVTRSHDYGTPFHSQQRSVIYCGDSTQLDIIDAPCTMHRYSFTVGNKGVYTALVDGYTRLPEAFGVRNTSQRATSEPITPDPSHIGFLVEIKKHVVIGSTVLFQVAAELVAFIYANREKFNVGFAKNAEKSQEALLILFAGDGAWFCLASFKKAYLDFLLSIDSDKPEPIDPKEAGKSLAEGLLRISLFGPFFIPWEPEHFETFAKIIVALDLRARKAAGTN